LPERKNSMRTELMQMLEDTLAVCGQGFYLVHGRRVSLKLSPKEMRAARVFLPDEIAALKSGAALSPLPAGGQCTHGCENTDSFSLAGKRCRELGGLPAAEAAREVLVLNLANPVHPGGGVRRGARAQEEDLCRKSTLLLSLEGAEAAEYYRYNRALQTNMGSDAVVVTPRVEIFRDESGGLLDETVVTAVMTCAAPMICEGLEGLTDAQYQALVYRRICGMLRCAAFLGYRYLVLGAFGCGAFGNDARTISDLFYRALKEFSFGGMREDDLFRRVEFAVLSRGSEQYNFREFHRNFGDGNFNRAAR